ncbi:hypothetical protein C8Q75DRAFT_331566 [Abortiporus biennis]|nr:hypothetical protein C8Q75DRAFT_331566 [Abortiporus biennis]
MPGHYEISISTSTSKRTFFFSFASSQHFYFHSIISSQQHTNTPVAITSQFGFAYSFLWMHYIHTHIQQQFFSSFFAVFILPFMQQDTCHLRHVNFRVTLRNGYYSHHRLVHCLFLLLLFMIQTLFAFNQQASSIHPP